MAHFAELDLSNTVVRVVVFQGEGLDGEEACASFFGGGIWKQTSYNGSTRKNFAGVGYTFDAVRNAFIPPQPFESWILDDEACLWRAPAPYPDDGGRYSWSEESLAWVAD